MTQSKTSTKDNSPQSKASVNVINTMLSSGTLAEGAVIIVGFSGGPDSLCLLHGLRHLADAMEFTLIPVHVNHHLRGDKADAEQEHAISICEKLDLDCLVYDADCKELAEQLGVSTEEAGRTVRYEIFDDVAEQLESQGIDPDNIFIAVAHNADDQSETVLFRLMRGTGVHGLAGISPIRHSNKGYMIIRPLLEVTRDEIEEYIRSFKLRPNRDESNDVADVTRNKIRLKLIPYIEKNYNPNIKEALRRYAEIAEIDDSFMEEIAYSLCESAMEIDTVREALVLDITELRNQHIAINRRVATICLKSLGLADGASYELILAIIELFYSSNPSASINLPAGFIAQREYDTVVFMPADKAGCKSPVDDYRLIPQVMMKHEFQPIKGEVYAAFDYDKFNARYPGKVGEITLRTRREGDYIAIKDGKSKKLQDYFVDAKIVQSERDSILVAAIGSEILWIVPNAQLPSAKQRENGRFSQNYQLTDTSERVLFLELTVAI